MTKKKKIIYATCTIVGTTVGVGFFALPYIASKVGFAIMFLYLVALAAITLCIDLIYSDISLETKDFLRFPGFVEVYFGEKWKKAISVLVIFGLLGTMLAYLIVGGTFLTAIFSPIFGGSEIVYTLFYFIVGATLIYLGIKMISKTEFFIVSLFFLFLILLFVRSYPIINIKNLFPVPNMSYIFLPYGAILFALCGRAVIPEAEEMLGKDKKLLKKIIIPLAVLIPFIIYTVFIFLVLGISGAQTTESAVLGLQSFLGQGIVRVGLLFGVIATFSAFLGIGLTLQKTLSYDLKIAKKIAWAIACFVPLVLFLVGVRNFIEVIGFVGGIVLGTEGIFIILMYQKLKNPTKRQKILAFPLILIFILGIIYQIIYFVK